MKIYLNVPYAEKDEARRLGATWNIARRIWFIEDRANLTPFLRWMPKHLLVPCKAVSMPAPPIPLNVKKARRKANKQRQRAERLARQK